MATRHDQWPEALRRAALEGRGESTTSERKAVAAGPGAGPEAARAYLEKVHRHAYKITDEDVAAMRAAGLSEERIFELTVAAAVGAGLTRLDAGLRALRGK